MLQLEKAEAVEKPEVDVRETAVPPEFETNFAQNTANQDLAVAGGWTDLTAMSVALTLKESRKVLIIGTVQALPGDNVANFGFSIRIDVGGTPVANSVRDFLGDWKTDVGNDNVLTDGSTTSISLATQHLVTLATGSHTIKLQGLGNADGTTFAVRFQKKNLSVVIL